MFRTIVTLALIILLVFGCWMLYKRVNGEGTLGAGNVYVTNPGTSKDDGNGSTFFAEKPLEEAHPTPSRSDDPGTINTEPVVGYNSSTASNTPPQPSYPTQPASPQPFGQVYSQQQYGQSQTGQQEFGRSPYSSEKPLPAGDTFAPNPPSGLAYSGEGNFEVYRQGDLTYRLDTKTGESCVLYATMEEWKKPIVYSHGCGSHGWHRKPRG